MKAVVLSAYNTLEWRTVEEPICKDDEVKVRVSYGCICGSDQHIFKGEFHPRTQTPLVMGHEFAGRIVEVGSEVSGYAVNDKVAVDPIIWCGECPACRRGHYPACVNLKLIGIDLDGGFSEYISVPASMLYKVPGKIPDRYVALIEVLGIGCHAKNRAGVKAGDTVLIWGAGKVGLCILQAVRTVTDKRVIMVDVIQERLNLATQYYENVDLVNALEEDPVEKIKTLTNGTGVDVAFEAVGHARDIPNQVEPVRGCIQSIRGAGTVCVLGLGDEPVPILFKELIWKEARIVASRVSHGEFSEAIDHLDNNRLQPDMLITSVLPASEAQRGFEQLEKYPEKNVKILLDFQ